MRRDGLDIVKKLERITKSPRTIRNAWPNDVQKATDEMISEIDHLLAAKEKEILTV